MKAWTPNSFPSIINLAKTAAWVEYLPKSPGQNLVDVIVGLFIKNESVDLSKVAVVSSCATFEPCPNSV